MSIGRSRVLAGCVLPLTALLLAAVFDHSSGPRGRPAPPGRLQKSITAQARYRITRTRLGHVPRSTNLEPRHP